MTHDDLMNSLASHLTAPNRMVWRDLQLGPAHSPRPDVYTLDKSFTRPNPRAFECKVSVSDFRSDVTSGKWQAYLKYAGAVIFAVPKGLVQKTDIPAKCGLIVRHPSGTWRMARKPTIEPTNIPKDAYMKLLIDGVHREGPAMRQKFWNEDQILASVRVNVGELVAKAVTDRLAVEEETARMRARSENRTAQAHKDAENIKETARESLSELVRVLGLEEGARMFQISSAIRQMRSERENDPAVRDMRRLVSDLQNLVGRYESRYGEQSLVIEEQTG